MSYNFLKDAHTVKNSTLCRYDTLNGYSTDFHINGNVDGWDVYNNIYVYGCWNGVLFGTSYERSCYVSRSNVFIYVEAENYYIVKIMMKITNNSDKEGLTTGRIQWAKIGDSTWNSEKQMDFDIIADDRWHLYVVNMGPAKEWQGNINNLRVYPFIDGRPGDQFDIKHIKISSIDKYTCSNTQCSYYTKYSNPCEGAGSKASCEASLDKDYYTTISGINDELVVNIDAYGNEIIHLGTNHNISGRNMAKVIGNRLSQLNVGGYAYSEVEHTFFDKLKIFSGSSGLNSSIAIGGGSAAYELGFLDEDGNNISTYVGGSEQSSGFDYAAARRLKSFEINKLIDGSKESTAYLHDPNQYNVEGGKRSFIESSTSDSGNTSAYLMYYKLFDNTGKTLIDVSHPINDSGKLNKIYVCGVVIASSSVLILRPHKNGDFTVMHELDLPVDQDEYLYTVSPVNYRIDCDILVSKGDVIAVYNADVRVPLSRRSTNLDATFYQINGKPSGRFDPGECHSYGVLGFDIYTRSDRLQTNILLDVDLGERVNIEEFNVYGRELNEYFEFNIACCLDLSWDVNLFGETHWHHMSHAYSTVIQRNFEHTNIAYGEECLDDGITTPDNGRQGDTFYGGGNSGSDITTVGHHAYFYVNGDGEWAYKYNVPGDSYCPKHEFCWPWGNHRLVAFTHDPIAFTLLFPYEYEVPIHKSVMYFKESDNFKHFALSYFLGPYDISGNADNQNFRYIPKYNVISLDGVDYTEDSQPESIFKDVAGYLFNNPLPWPHAIYENKKCINWPIVHIAGNTHWNVISHEFDPITCKGFRIFCDYHNSTKINELEVYSRIKVDPSLVDNTSLIFSDYGEDWNSGNFYEDLNNNEKIISFVGGAPRYINIEIESQAEFKLYELELLVGDEIKLKNCEENFLLDDTKLGTVSDYTMVELENIYGKPCDLIVDLPKELYNPHKVLSWMTLSSDEDITNPQVGPGGIVHKNDDYPIRIDNSQIAINDLCYGLKNLIHDKKAYVYEECEIWNEFGTLSSGVSVDYSNLNNYKTTTISFSGVSSKYWKIASTNECTISGILMFYNNERVDIDKVYYNSIPGASSQTFEAVHNNGCDIQEASFSATECVGVGLDNSTGVDTIKIVHSDVEFNNIVVYVSSDNDSNYAQIASKTQFMWNSADKNAGITLSNNSLTAENTGVTSVWRAVRSMVNKSSGKWYCEFVVNVTDMNRIFVGIGTSSEVLTYPGDTFEGYGYYGYNGYKYHSGGSSYGVYYTLNDVIGMAIDLDNGKIWWSKNGVWQASGDPAAGTNEAYSGLSGTFYIMTGLYDNGDKITVNFGATAFQYSAPSGFQSLYVEPTFSEIGINTSNYYRYFAIDLEKRHDLDIIRNYGSLSDKLFLSTGVNTEYSNTNLDDVNNVIWNNSDHNDTRWIRIPLLCGDGVERVLNKIGIYPDTEIPLCHDGKGYNCEWESFGTKFTNYNNPTNIALIATVSGSSYVEDFYPSNAVDGTIETYDYNLCWGFDADDSSPALYLDFGEVYSICRIDLYHGIGESNTDYQNVNYTIGVTTTASGTSYTDIVTVTSNGDFYRKHIFDPVDVRRVKLTITDYTSGDVNFYQQDVGKHVFLNGGLLREIEVYTYVAEGDVNSEDWPVVCVDLRRQFQLTGHELFNEYKPGANIDWDNSEDFFKYSDSVFDDPKKVSFFRAGNYVNVYSSSDTSEELDEDDTYIFDTEVYFDFGRHQVLWESYGAVNEDELSLGIINDKYTISDSNSLTGAGWINQTGVLDIPESGYYSVVAAHQFSSDSTCQVQNPIIRRSAGLIKWVSVKRDTAEEYSYDDASGKYGKDYLSRIKIYGSERYNPLEYWWWWNSNLSALSNNYLNVQQGACSLEIAYPTSSGIDAVSFIEGDDFGIDENWSEKDVISFLWYIDNVNNLNTSFGEFCFGAMYNDIPAYYIWDIENLSLSSGWNRIRLQFDKYDRIEPSDIFSFDDSMAENLDFRRDVTKSFRIRYRGKETPLVMNFDDLKIERNYFEDDVKFGKGLCLTDHEYLEIPSSDMNLRSGAVEFWLKPYYNHEGYDVFTNALSRNLFVLVNNNNDIISLGITSSSWFEIGFGNALRKYYLIGKPRDELVVDGGYFDRNQLMHLALAWGHDGTYMDNGDTVRFYIGGDLILSSKYTWEVTDTKSSSLILGGSSASIAYNSDSYGGGVFNNLKIYNYCKTEFDINKLDVYGDLPTEPNEFLQISKDGINFYGNDDGMMPFVFDEVSAGTKIPIYIRTNKNENFKSSDKKTGNIIVDWVVSV